MLYELEQVKREFGDRVVLNIDKLSLTARKIYALIGPNGAGKTTLLNLLSFLDRPTSGEIRYKDNIVSYEQKKLQPLRREVVLVDQSPILFSGSVFSNVEFGLKVRGIPKKVRLLKVSAALERVGMTSLAMANTNGLSGGEVKRVSLARALAIEPAVLLCDEPTANVDQQHQEVILKILEQANSMLNTSIIFSTHYLSQSRRLAHQTLVLHNGEISLDTGENTFDVTVSKHTENKSAIRLAGKHSMLLAVIKSDRIEQGQHRVHIIPECVSLRPLDAHKQQENHLYGTVTNIALQHKKVLIKVDAGIIIDVIMETERYRKRPPSVGDAVEIEISEDGLFFH